MGKWLLVSVITVAVPVMPARADAPPAVEHQPALCTVAEKPISLCAAISDDGTVAAARLYFRRAEEKYYSFVDMPFTGIDYCGTLPAPNGKTKAIEYYIQAVDDNYEATRTSTFRLPVEEEGVCEFPPLEEDEARAAAIKVFATSGRQGKKLDGGFLRTGVTFVPAKN
jgi:hypothetical protein